MKHLKYLMLVMEGYLDDSIAPKTFSKLFEFYFEDNEEVLKNEAPSEVIEILDNLHLDLAYFESDEKVAVESEEFFGEKELKNKVLSCSQKIAPFLK